MSMTDMIDTISVKGAELRALIRFISTAAENQETEGLNWVALLCIELSDELMKHVGALETEIYKKGKERRGKAN